VGSRGHEEGDRTLFALICHDLHESNPRGIIDPQIVAAVTALPVSSCLIDGEAIVCGEKGLAVFDLLRSFQHDGVAVLRAFDQLELDGEDLRHAPIETRKLTLKSLLRGKHGGITFNQHFEADGMIVYRHACALGCEGIVSKRLGSPYRSGSADCWVKVKNPAAPAVHREAEEDWDGRRRRR
jgi:bifunctional non-homologous end joining protein LigD